jgi:enterochelin esterase family protein
LQLPPRWRVGLTLWYFAVLLLAAAPAAAQDMPLSEVLREGEGWRPVPKLFKGIRGLASDRRGNVFVSHQYGRQISRIGTDGKVNVFARPESRVLGLCFGEGGRLYGCQPDRRRLVAWDAKGKMSTVASGVAAWDLVLTRRRVLYCTSPGDGAIYRVSPRGKVRRVDRGNTVPTGLVLWPDQGTLVVGHTGGRYLWTYRIDKDGALSARERYYTLRKSSVRTTAKSTGLTVDTKGRVYAPSPEGVQVFDPTGRLCGVLARPAAGENIGIAFGGARRDLLFTGCGDRVYYRKTRAQGVAPAKGK